VLSDWWEGLDKFYTPGEEILIARNTDQALDALQLTERELARIAGAARERTLSEHTSGHRARELECIFA
jgi:spore maturation protein CgeB